MTSLLEESPVMLGAEHPRVVAFPDGVSSWGREAVELAAVAGLHLDPWQQLVLEHALSERPDGKWAAFEVGLCVPRQNGKGAILEALELAGIFLLGERLIIHTAHQFDTSLEAFRRLEALIQDTPELHKRVKPKGYKHSHGEEGIEFRSGQRIRFRTRTKGGGRGFSCDRLIMDEAMIIPETTHGALLPTLSARENPQVVYAGSAVDQAVHDDGVVFARLRERGLAGEDPSLAWFEWSADFGSPEEMRDSDLGDERLWAEANPGLGIRIAAEYVENERRSMDARTFAVERLGVGSWPRTDGGHDSVFELEEWAALCDPSSAPSDPLVFAFDVTPDRARSSIAVSGLRPDGLPHIEVVDARGGTGWVAGRLAELNAAHKPVLVVCDATGPAASLLPDLDKAGVKIKTVSAAEHAHACGILFDAVKQGRLRHLGQDELSAAVAGASKRSLGDAWAWSRRSSAVDISPLVASTLALWGSGQPGRPTRRVRSFS